MGVNILIGKWEYTAAIDPNGLVRESIPRHAVDALPAQYGFRDDITFYTEHGPRIFRDRTRTRSLRRLLRAKYGREPLKNALSGVFGERTFGESAVVVPERAPEDLGRALVELCRQPQRWGEMAAAGRRHVESQHAIGRQMERLEALYDAVIAIR